MTSQHVHSFDLIARLLCERLQGRAASEELRVMVRPPGIDWQRVVGHASAQFVLPAFAAALRDLGLLGSLDDGLRAFLEAVHAANIERNNELRNELAAAIRVLNRAGIEPVLLKGAIRLLDGLYPDDGWRMLRDLDLLVPEASLARAARAFEEAGYAPCGLDNHIRRTAGACQIDLHKDLFSGSQDRLMAAVTILNGSRSLAFGDGRVRIPSVEHQLMHLIGHSQIRHCGYAIGRIALRDRLEAAALVHWGNASIDWQAVSACFAAAGYYRPLLSFLLALRDGAWCAVPVTGRIDPLTALQQRRIALQAHSEALGYIGSRVGWLVSEFKSQIIESGAGECRAVTNFKRLMFERGAVARMARAFLIRARLALHGLPHVTCFIAQ
jgi:Uncharacterised nucleotidyltransferase